MEFSQLRYFVKVAERSSFTRAGQELGITQPALSRAIARLEEEVGQPLFERRPRSMALTDAGKVLLARAAQILAMAEDVLAELTEREDRGRICVGAIPTIAPYLLPRVLRSYRDDYPQVQVVVYEETTDRLLQRCQHGEVEVAVLAAPATAKYLATEDLFEEELFVVLPADHPLAAKAAVALGDLRKYPFVLLDETHCLSESILSFCRQRAFQPLAVQHTSQLATVEELVALGHGVSLIPEMAKEVDTSERRVYRRVSGPAPKRTIVLAWNPYRFQSRRAERFKERLRRLAANGRRRR